MNNYEIIHKGIKHKIKGEVLIKTMMHWCVKNDVDFNEIESCVLMSKKERALVFEIESTSFTIPNEHGIVKLILPFGWEKIKHFKAGMKVKVKLIKD